MMKPDRVLQMIRLNQPPIVGINSTATEFIFYKLSVTTSNYIELFVLEIELKLHNLFRWIWRNETLPKKKKKT